jgi:hypothetical protein
MNETAVNESFERSPALPSFQQTYHEISDRHVSESDVLAQLHANIAQLEDLHGRLRFMMREVTYLLKRS